MINHYFDKTVSSQAGETAIIYHDRRISFFELFIYVEWIARYFQSIAVQPGQRVAILIPNSPEWMISFLGVLRVGAAAVPLEVTHSEHDLCKAMALAKPHVIITTPPYKTLLDAIVDRSNQHASLDAQVTVAVFEEDNIVTIGGSRDSQPLALDSRKNGQISSPSPIHGDGSIKVRKSNGVVKENEPSAVLIDSPALIQVDTQAPLGFLEYSHANLIAQAEATIAEIQLTAADRLLCLAPFAQGESISKVLITSMLSGAALVIMDSQSMDEIYKVLGEEHVTILAGQVPLLAQLSENHLVAPADQLSLRAYVCIGEPLPSEIGERLYQQFGISFRRAPDEIEADMAQRS